MYTHYWKWDKPIARVAAFRAWSNDVRTLYYNLPEHGVTAGAYYEYESLTIGGPNNEGSGEPVFTDTFVGFNGRGFLNDDEQHGQELSGSVFSIRLQDMKRRHYDFCPTGRKPYDLLVCAALIRLKVHFPTIQVASDGDPAEWMQALNLCQQVFGQDGGHIPFTEGEEFDSHTWT